MGWGLARQGGTPMSASFTGERGNPMCFSVTSFGGDDIGNRCCRHPGSGVPAPLPYPKLLLPTVPKGRASALSAFYIFD